MIQLPTILFCIFILSMANLCDAKAEVPSTQALTPAADKTITLLFTNDVESAYHPPGLLERFSQSLNPVRHLV